MKLTRQAEPNSAEELEKRGVTFPLQLLAITNSNLLQPFSEQSLNQQSLINFQLPLQLLAFTIFTPKNFQPPYSPVLFQHLRRKPTDALRSPVLSPDRPSLKNLQKFSAILDINSDPIVPHVFALYREREIFCKSNPATQSGRDQIMIHPSRLTTHAGKMLPFLSQVPAKANSGRSYKKNPAGTLLGAASALAGHVELNQSSGSINPYRRLHLPSHPYHCLYR